MSKEHSINSMEITAIWREILQSLKDTEAPQSFLREYVRKLEDTASIALQSQNLEEFTRISGNFSNHIFLDWFLDRWPDYVESIAIIWREFGWKNFRSASPEIDFYYKYLKVFQDIVRFSAITNRPLSNAIDTLKFYDQAIFVARDWPEEYGVASALPYIGIEQALILAHRKEKIGTEEFVKEYLRLLEVQVLCASTSIYSVALGDSIANQLDWEFWAIHMQDSASSGGAWVGCRNEILLALTLRVACKKASYDWAESLTTQDLEHMIKSLTLESTLDILTNLLSTPIDLTVGNLSEELRQKRERLQEKISEEVAELPIEPKIVNEFFSSAKEIVHNYKTPLVQRLLREQTGIHKDPDMVLYINLDKRYFLNQIDRTHYHLQPDLFLEPQSEIDEGHLIENLVKFAEESQNVFEEFTQGDLAGSREVIKRRLGKSIEGGAVICVNLEWHEREEIRDSIQDSAEFFEVTYRYGVFRKSIICLGSIDDVHWNQFEVKPLDEPSLFHVLLENGRFSIEIHEVPADRLSVDLKFRQSYSIDRNTNSRIVQILVGPGVE